MTYRSDLLVVGGSRGIGLALAKEALIKKRKVTVVARTKSDDIQDSDIDFIQQDFNETSLARSILVNVQPDVLILCVAQGLYGDILSFSDEQILNCIQTSYTSTVLWIREAINFLPDNSKIGWISSLTAKVPSQDWSYYASAKAGVEHLIDCMRGPALARGISITVCYPGCVATDFHRCAGAQAPEDAVQPSEVAGDLLQAVTNRLEFWASDIDKDVIEEVYKSQKSYRNKFRHSLK